MSILECKQLEKSYDQVKVLQGISYCFEPGKHYVIQGASGSGKSTLLHLLGGLDRADGGDVCWNGQNILAWDDEQLALHRNLNIGFIFQFHYLLPTMTVGENILLPQKIASFSQRKMKQNIFMMRQDEITSLAQRLDILTLWDRYPAQISGGERQRVNLLRSVVMCPKLLLCDEPTGNLDSKNSRLVVSILHEFAEQFQATLIVVTHSVDVSSTFASTERLFMKDGNLQHAS